MVDRIKAKCRQAGATIPGLVGALIGKSMEADSRNFVDIHASSHGVKKSHHFVISDVRSPAKERDGAQFSSRKPINKDLMATGASSEMRDAQNDSATKHHLQTMHNKY